MTTSGDEPDRKKRWRIITACSMSLSTRSKKDQKRRRDGSGTIRYITTTRIQRLEESHEESGYSDFFVQRSQEHKERKERLEETTLIPLLE